MMTKYTGLVFIKVLYEIPGFFVDCGWEPGDTNI